MGRLLHEGLERTDVRERNGAPLHKRTPYTREEETPDRLRVLFLDARLLGKEALDLFPSELLPFLNPATVALDTSARLSASVTTTRSPVGFCTRITGPWFGLSPKHSAVSLSSIT